MRKKTIFMETTGIVPEKTIAEIQQILRHHGVRRFNLVYDNNGEIEAVYFTLRIQNGEVPYKLPAKWEPLLGMAMRGETKYLKRNDAEHARRIAWRQILRWIEAQLAMIDIEMVRPEEVFLPYMVVDGQNETMYERLMQKGFSGYLLTDGK